MDSRRPGASNVLKWTLGVAIGCFGLLGWATTIAFWLYNLGLVLWIALNFFPIGWSQLPFAIAALTMAYEFRRPAQQKESTKWNSIRLRPTNLILPMS